MAKLPKPLTLRHLFMDSDGKVVLGQLPNAPLYCWLAFTLFSLIAPAGRFKTGTEHLATAFIFVWAYLETTAGTTYFRRLTGIVVSFIIVYGFFSR